jgi:myo-inositol catabolism protein IolC
MNPGSASTSSSQPFGRLFLLAMDHRDSLLRDLYKIAGKPTDEQIRLVSHGKKLVFNGLMAAIAGGLDAAAVGILVDELYGAQVARSAKEAHLDLAMPIERSGEKIFALQYGDVDGSDWLEHLSDFEPDQVKVLVRANPSDSPSDLKTQFDRLALVSSALKESGRVFLIELLVPASHEQLASVNGNALRYDTELRPELTRQLIGAMQEANIEPLYWKVEGLETAVAAAAIVKTARQGGRGEVQLIVLGRDAPRDRLDHWLRVAAPIEGFIGFAIGRSVWEQPLAEQLAGNLSEHEMIVNVAANFAHFVDVFTRAQGETRNLADA